MDNFCAMVCGVEQKTGILDHRKIFAKAANTVNDRAPVEDSSRWRPKRRGTGELGAITFQSFPVRRLRTDSTGGQIAIALKFGPIRNNNVRARHPGDRKPPFQCVRGKQVVGIDKLNPLSHYFGNTAIARLRNAAIRPAEDANARIERPRHCERIVNGAVVDDYYLPLLALTEARLDSIAQERFRVECGNNDTDRSQWSQRGALRSCRDVNVHGWHGIQQFSKRRLSSTYSQGV